MTEEKNERKNEREKGSIKIDYDNIDVADIMNQIKKEIAEEPIKPVQEFAVTSSPQYPIEGEEEAAPGFRGKIKKMLLKIMKPFSPLIKILVLPIHEEVMETNRNLHQTNRRLDYLEKGSIGRRMEYTKLLHNLTHNIVVELTKLKIEEESLKLKAQILEKDFEFLSKRERALEKEVFK